MALSYLTGSVTQGAADAYAQAEVATALQGLSNIAFRIREILFEHPSLGTANLANMELALTRRTKAAMANVSDRDVIAKVFKNVALTTSGTYIGERVVRYVFSEDDEVLIVEDPVYFSIDSNATSLANTAQVRIGYERVSITALDRLTLLTASLE